MHRFWVEQRPHNGLTYEAFVAAWKQALQQPLSGLDAQARRYLYYRRYNFERAQRVTQAYRMSERLARALASVEQPQLWMVLTEDWCADSAYSLPIIAEASRRNPLIQLRILRRDENLDIMDLYLTRGARSIPKLVAFAEDGTELFTWGPRPAEAQALRDRLQAEGMDARQLAQALIDWYEAGGWQHVDVELAACLEQVLPSYSSSS
ncbi:Thioredoxin [Rhodothermus profundi]|uniref:Thioredoxin n=2 Tax=Rhodothermus profundi TaxID=633813 RepID=A0A1M6SHI2_9BACT|nr:Thioredoxin [Rhodothermus profundi]